MSNQSIREFLAAAAPTSLRISDLRRHIPDTEEGMVARHLSEYGYYPSVPYSEAEAALNTFKARNREMDAVHDYTYMPGAEDYPRDLLERDEARLTPRDEPTESQTRRKKQERLQKFSAELDKSLKETPEQTRQRKDRELQAWLDEQKGPYADDPDLENIGLIPMTRSKQEDTPVDAPKPYGSGFVLDDLDLPPGFKQASTDIVKAYAASKKPAAPSAPAVGLEPDLLDYEIPGTVMPEGREPSAKYQEYLAAARAIREFKFGRQEEVDRIDPPKPLVSRIMALDDRNELREMDRRYLTGNIQVFWLADADQPDKASRVLYVTHPALLTGLIIPQRPGKDGWVSQWPLTATRFLNKIPALDIDLIAGGQLKTADTDFNVDVARADTRRLLLEFENMSLKPFGRPGELPRYYQTEDKYLSVFSLGKKDGKTVVHHDVLYQNAEDHGRMNQWRAFTFTADRFCNEYGRNQTLGRVKKIMAGAALIDRKSFQQKLGHMMLMWEEMRIAKNRGTKFMPRARRKALTKLLSTSETPILSDKPVHKAKTLAEHFHYALRRTKHKIRQHLQTHAAAKADMTIRP